MKLSKSKVNTYLKCPLEFKFQYIDKIEVPENEYMIIGSDVHLIAEKFMKKFNGKLSNININNELLKIAFDLDIGYDLNTHIDNLGLFFKNMFIDKDYKIFSIEEYLFDEKNNFSGIVDIILENENNELIIIDYKTGSSSSFSKYRLELCYYKLLVENIYNKEVTSVGIFFTKNGKLRLLDIDNNDNKRKYLSDSELNEAIRTLKEVRENINKENFQPKKQFLCKYCTYQNICKKYDII